MRTGSVGSAEPGAVVKPHRTLIFANPGPLWARKKSRNATQILRAGSSIAGQRDNPRNGGLGVSRHWRTKFASAVSPSVFWFLFHVEKKLAQ